MATEESACNRCGGQLALACVRDPVVELDAEDQWPGDMLAAFGCIIIRVCQVCRRIAEASIEPEGPDPSL